MTAFPDHIRVLRARRHAGMTQQQLAEHVGVQRSAVAQWERLNGTRPTSSRMAAVAVVTGVSADWLMTGRGAMLTSYTDALASPAASPCELSLDEVDLIKALRRLDTERRCALLNLIGAWAA
ncbi:helix-turn-helix domain-containing protein [Tahibacter aquaticus]|nr:helix-turn-helix transcriptional regulator [Tahibacter aquaticus]